MERNKENMQKKENYEEFKRFRNRELLYQKAIIEKIEARSRTSRLYLWMFSVSVFSIMFSIMMLFLEDGKYIDKTLLQKDISLIISNDGDLRAIKQAFANQPKISDFKIILSSKAEYYPKTIALSSVLDDVRVSAFINNEKELLPKLESIMNEYEEINPFDKLQIGQKDYFENIRIKTDENYPKIRNDINNLVDELHQKNLLVDEYLSDSKMSYWISIFAVFLSLAIGGYQIFTGRPEALKKALIGLLSEPNAEDNSNKKNQPNS
ncbi:hypothetical protein ACW5XF_07060 [Aeromonas lusitana]|uniref:hypothetical protein n=1 Tax=Aeromonas lusitana TaxID=931529 RepID=UPI0012FDD571|nr:hypothetical protein [Aeromonas lusitana]